MMINITSIIAMIALVLVGNGSLVANENSISMLDNSAPLKPLTCVGFDAPFAAGPVTVTGMVAMPIKAQLIDSSGRPMDDYDLVAEPVLQVVFRSAIRTDAADVSGQSLAAKRSSSGNRFGYITERWQFNLRSSDYSAPGTYHLRLLSGNPQEYSIVKGCEALLVIR